MSKLALLGGNPVREASIPWVNTMGSEETEAVLAVMNSGCLSAYYGRAGDKFLGGPKVLEMEQVFAQKFGSRFAISVNSATTALHTAIAACGIGPGDEVLVTPYSMVASATAIVMNNAVPVFVDIDPITYNLDPTQIERWITPNTKAIMVANIFGLPAALNEIITIARKHGLFVIEDNAQGPGATINGKFAGTFGDIGVFSLNYHKVIHSGEGGLLLTDNEELARNCQLVRNHGEAVVDDLNDYETVVLGSNYRMTELHAAIGIEQLKKLDHFLVERRRLAQQFTSGLNQFTGLKGVVVPDGYEHSYYIYPIQYNKEDWGISRSTFAQAMNAEGYPLGIGYVKPIYLIPMYQHKKVYNQTQYPFSLIEKPTQDYQKGLCPVTEAMYEEKVVIADVCRLPYKESDIDDALEAIQKIWMERGKLLEYEAYTVSRT
ncbi:DegT/DnrJ/EryC1/StrS family aminotransferase [Paenibacillus agricola]|uniref:DegT/DnrJ/EryC1/StrS family aminotransferase n=1 Tax=Paenibacillus agricola TaxID=2716264 RepID=A0ABX0JJ14_9BACL|nr:DegT/DnrJ/EryC1/StrS family aminotransferase [Paenibacillus agricola]NHN33881.1 DegT/DnrJ/EryC1/StrS family aminotransferase [Paenibacillus agricola]